VYVCVCVCVCVCACVCATSSLGPASRALSESFRALPRVPGFHILIATALNEERTAAAHLLRIRARDIVQVVDEEHGPTGGVEVSPSQDTEGG